MTDSEIIEALRSKLGVPVGRHLYGILGSYADLERFARKLQQAKTPDGRLFPKAISVNRGILDSIPDDEFRALVANEARRPGPTAAHVAQAFQKFLRSNLSGKGIIVLANMEMLLAYNVDLSPLRVLTTDENRLLLLLPGKRERDRIVIFPELEEACYTLPTNLIAENHLWELKH